jgi:hypothetical protein
MGNSGTSIGIEWPELAAQTLAVKYYSLYMDDGRGVYFNKVYQGACSKAII